MRRMGQRVVPIRLAAHYAPSLLQLQAPLTSWQLYSCTAHPLPVSRAVPSTPLCPAPSPAPSHNTSLCAVRPFPPSPPPATNTHAHPPPPQAARALLSVVLADGLLRFGSLAPKVAVVMWQQRRAPAASVAGGSASLRHQRHQARLLTVVECAFALYRCLLPAPVWYVRGGVHPGCGVGGGMLCCAGIHEFDVRVWWGGWWWGAIGWCMQGITRPAAAGPHESWLDGAPPATLAV